VLKQIEGKYEILHKLEEGGMGAVYKVRHRLLEEIHVVKVMRPQHAEDAELQQRFLGEAVSAIKLRHPNVVQIYDFATDSDGTAYIVMEYIDGVTVDDILRGGVLPSLGFSLEIARQSLRALGYLHSQDFVHRDVAPDNLMLARDFDGSPLIKLIDLGIAKQRGGGSLTQTGTFMGKVRYSSPEQFAGPGAHTLDRRSDLYSFGVLLYDLVTGHCPIGGTNLSQVIAAHLFQPPLAFSESDPEGRVPEGLRKVILKTLAKRPEDRPQTAEELSAALAQFQTPSGDLGAELGRILVAARRPPTEEASQRAGSTQARLDREFGVEGFTETTLRVPEPGARASRDTAARPPAPLAPVTAPSAPPAAWAAPMPPTPSPPAAQPASAQSASGQSASGQAASTDPSKSEPSSRELPTAVDLKNPIHEAVYSIEQQIAAGSLRTAARMLAFARLRFGDHPRLAELAVKLKIK
jgi:serine/threonine-protein kinase